MKKKTKKAKTPAKKRDHSLWFFPESGDAMVCTAGKDGGRVVPLRLHPAFDFEDHDGYTYWCVRHRLWDGESDVDSEPIAMILNGTGMTLLDKLMVDGHKLTDTEADGMQHEMAGYVAALFSLAPEMKALLGDIANGVSSLLTDKQREVVREKHAERASELLGRLYDMAKP